MKLVSLFPLSNHLFKCKVVLINLQTALNRSTLLDTISATHGTKLILMKRQNFY